MLISSTADVVESERRRALRALLRSPLLPSSGERAEEYILVRRHSDWLKNWLMKFPSWGLHIDQHVARLRKTPPDSFDETRPAIDQASGTAFTRRRYALLCLALAALELSDTQTTLSGLAQTIVELIAADPELEAAGLLLDIGNYDQRRDLVHAVRLLMDTGILRRLDGDERQFLDGSGTSDVLYEIHRPVLTAMLNVSRSPSSVESVADLVEEAAARERLIRALLDDPILYFHDLNEDERRYLEEHRGYLLRQISEATGMVAEIRREGIAMMDDEGDLTDLQLPEESKDGAISLMLVQWFAEFAKKRPGAAIPVSAVEEYVRRKTPESGAEAWVTQDALLRLRGLRLIQSTDAGVVPLPACARYATDAGVSDLPPVAQE
jgi:uncharacterized protein (TIGR02678 family)